MSDTHPPTARCQVFELRRYRLHPGRRQALTDLFERAFVAPQQEVGMTIAGPLWELDDDDRFTWLRGFADMAARRQALQAFYGSPVWAAHRDEANATMVDSDDVRLLRPAWPHAALTLEPASPTGPRGTPARCVAITLLPLRRPADEALLAMARGPWSTALQAAGAQRQAWLVTEAAANDYPRLPVRTDGPWLVAVAAFAEPPQPGPWAGLGAWAAQLGAAAGADLAGPIDILRVVPTARSALSL